MRKLIIFIALLTVVLAGCRLETNVSMDIADDGSAEVTLEVGLDDEFLGLIESSGLVTGEDFVDDMFSDVDGDVLEPRVEGDMTYYATVIQVDDLSTWDHQDAMADFFSSFSYSQDDEGAQLTATIDGAAEEDFGDLGDLGLDPSAITGDIFSASLIVNMPGSVTESNATEVSDGALVWEIPIGESVDVAAESSFSGSSNAWIWILLAAVLAIGVLAGIVAVVMTRKSSQQAVDDAIAAHEAKLAAQPATDSPAEADPTTEEE